MKGIDRVNRFARFIADSLPLYGVPVTGFTPAENGVDANLDLGLKKLDELNQVDFGYGVTLTPSGWVIFYKYHPSFRERMLKPIETWHAGASNTLAALKARLSEEFGPDCVRLLRKGEFNLDNPERNYPGYTQDEYWNGWAVPYFELDVGKQIIQDISADPAAGVEAYFDETRNAFIIRMDEADESDAYEGELIDGKMLYSIGGAFWTWQEKSEEVVA